MLSISRVQQMSCNVPWFLPARLSAPPHDAANAVHTVQSVARLEQCGPRKRFAGSRRAPAVRRFGIVHAMPLQLLNILQRQVSFPASPEEGWNEARAELHQFNSARMVHRLHSLARHHQSTPLATCRCIEWVSKLHMVPGACLVRKQLQCVLHETVAHQEAALDLTPNSAATFLRPGPLRQCSGDTPPL